MDAFSRTFLSVAAAWTGVAIPFGNRQVPVLRRCIEDDDAPVLLTHCTGARSSEHGGGYLLLLTHRRLVVTRRTGLLRHRIRLHLNAELRHLGAVTWHADDRRCLVELAVTVVDGVRERFLIRTTGPEPLRRIDALLQWIFRSTSPVPAGSALAPRAERSPLLLAGHTPPLSQAGHTPTAATIRMTRPARPAPAAAG